MKKFLYTMAAMFISPIVVIGFAIYIVSYILQLLFRTIILYFENFMNWVDRNITRKI